MTSYNKDEVVILPISSASMVDLIKAALVVNEAIKKMMES